MLLNRQPLLLLTTMLGLNHEPEEKMTPSSSPPPSSFSLRVHVCIVLAILLLRLFLRPGIFRRSIPREADNAVRHVILTVVWLQALDWMSRMCPCPNASGAPLVRPRSAFIAPASEAAAQHGDGCFIHPRSSSLLTLREKREKPLEDAPLEA